MRSSSDLRHGELSLFDQTGIKRPDTAPFCVQLFRAKGTCAEEIPGLITELFLTIIMRRTVTALVLPSPG